MWWWWWFFLEQERADDYLNALAAVTRPNPNMQTKSYFFSNQASRCKEMK